MKKHLRVRNIKLVPIGNSKGIRLPKEILLKYRFSDSLLMEETEKGILLHKKKDKKLSWEETYQAIAEEKENWNDFDVTLSDGLEEDLDPKEI